MSVANHYNKSCDTYVGDCDRVSTTPTNISEREYGLVVRLSRKCGDHTDSPIFCEGSGWGDEEANVVCKSKMNTTYGLGGNFYSYSPYN